MDGAGAPAPILQSPVTVALIFGRLPPAKKDADRRCRPPCLSARCPSPLSAVMSWLSPCHHGILRAAWLSSPCSSPQFLQNSVAFASLYCYNDFCRGGKRASSVLGTKLVQSYRFAPICSLRTELARRGISPSGHPLLPGGVPPPRPTHALQHEPKSPPLRLIFSCSAERFRLLIDSRKDVF